MLDSLELKRGNTSKITNSLIDEARAQNRLASELSAGFLPFIRTSFLYRKCYVILDNIQYDIDKVKKLSKYTGVLNKLYERA